jgi:anion-transporting  ArsA/GET3 family ATPase
MKTASPLTLARVLEGKRLVVLVGDGGVGKTSASAAVAYGRAVAGDRVGVLTIDPAPRLGDALGLGGIDAEPRSVPLPLGTRGCLAAMRLDSRRTFDRMVERHAASAEAAEALLAHPLYRAVAGGLGGAENYMAFQRLHELVEAQTFRSLVVDTPPAIHAADLLAAPARLNDLLDTGALSILAEPARIVSRAGGRLARAAFGVLLAALERVTGSALQSTVADFADRFGQLLGGLEGRARAIDSMLHGPGTAFVLVTRPREPDVRSALALREELAGLGLPVDAVLVNRVTAPRTEATPASRSLADLPAPLRAAVVSMESDLDALREVEAAALARLREGLGTDDPPPVLTTRDRDQDVSSLGDIAELATELGF